MFSLYQSAYWFFSAARGRICLFDVPDSLINMNDIKSDEIIKFNSNFADWGFIRKVCFVCGKSAAVVALVVCVNSRCAHKKPR